MGTEYFTVVVSSLGGLFVLDCVVACRVFYILQKLDTDLLHMVWSWCHGGRSGNTPRRRSGLPSRRAVRRPSGMEDEVQKAMKGGYIWVFDAIEFVKRSVS